MELDDLDRIKIIWEQYYKDEFEFPDFFNGFIAAFIVEHKGSIITAGGIRPILESVMITNKDLSPRERREGLMEALAFTRYATINAGMSEFHAFIQDRSWKNALLKHGFQKCKGEALIFGVR